MLQAEANPNLEAPALLSLSFHPHLTLNLTPLILTLILILILTLILTQILALILALALILIGTGPGKGTPRLQALQRGTYPVVLTSCRRALLLICMHSPPPPVAASLHSGPRQACGKGQHAIQEHWVSMLNRFT